VVRGIEEAVIGIITQKDFSSESGLRRLLGKHQRLLAYSIKKNRVRYEKIISQWILGRNNLIVRLFSLYY
jgi:hypothetical protein